MRNKKKENSVRSLTNLYTVVIGVALTYSVTQVLDPTKGISAVQLSDLMLFFAFIVTLFPFFHGALRHLDDAYLENNNPHIKDGALIIDFILLFVHALAFVILSLLINNPGSFGWVLIILLAIDIIWGAFAHFGSSSKGNMTSELKWTIINLLFVVLGVWYLVKFNIPLSGNTSDLSLAIAIAGSCSIRSMLDYIWCHDFYFPK